MATVAAGRQLALPLKWREVKRMLTDIAIIVNIIAMIIRTVLAVLAYSKKQK